MTFRDFILAELKCAALRSRLVTAELDSIGVALAGNFITEDDAIAWLDECGGLQFVSAPRDTAELATE
jgi:hypothetical protein